MGRVPWDEPKQDGSSGQWQSLTITQLQNTDWCWATFRLGMSVAEHCWTCPQLCRSEISFNL